MNCLLAPVFFCVQTLRRSLLCRLLLSLVVVAALATVGSLARNSGAPKAVAAAGLPGKPDAGAALGSLRGGGAVVVAPTLGNYPHTTVSTSGNTTITPDAAPTGATSISASTDTNFQGMLTVNPATGVLRVTNARPAGTYLVTVRAVNDSTSITSIFTLRVQAAAVCLNTPVTFTNAGNVSVGQNLESVAIGDFNNDGKQDLVTVRSGAPVHPGDVVFGLVSIQLGDGAGNFSTASNIGVNTHPGPVAIGDFNNDGNQDLAIPNPSLNVSPSTNGPATVLIRLGDGTGHFSSAPSISVGNSPRSVSIGDFNGDGNQDLAIANGTLGTNVLIRLGDGAGNFSGSTQTSLVSSSSHIAIGDFNSDGKQDLALATPGLNSISVQFGDGAGNFNSTTNVSISSGSDFISVGDFNNDGKQDLAVANVNANISIRLGDGMGHFSSAPDVSAGGGPFSIGDFNNDGNQDLAIPNPGSNTVSILLGDGTGNFSSAADISVGNSPKFIASGDFNNDGREDLAAANGGSDDVSIRLGSCAAVSGLVRRQGSPALNSTVATTTGNATVTVNGASSATVNGVTVSNLVNTNGTVTADVAAACGATDASFTLQASGGAAITPTTLNVAVTANTAPVLSYTNLLNLSGGGNTTINPATGPADNGSISSIVVQSTGTYTGAITVNNTTGAVSVSNAGPVGSHTITIRATDNCGVTTDASFTLNVLPVLTLGNYPNRSVALSGNTTIKPDTAPTGATGMNASTSADFKGMLMADPTTGVVRVTDAHPSGTYTVTVAALNDATITTRTFQLTVQAGATCNGTNVFTNASDVSVGIEPASVAIGDFNNDGKQDLAVVNTYSSAVSIRLGDGTGGFSGTTELSVGINSASVAVGDFNNDGKQDLAVGSTNLTRVSIRLGDGTGGFSGTTELVVGNASTIAVGDFNNDGKQDLATTTSIWLGDGTGNFSNGPGASVGGGPFSIGDFNNDGKQDLAVINQGSNKVLIRLGDGTGYFGGPTNVSVGDQPGSIALGDFNNDGKQDLAVTNNTSKDVSIRLGDGTGHFSGSTNISLGSQSFLGNLGNFNIAVGDFNNDGKQDLAITNEYKDTLSIGWGDGTGNFSIATDALAGVGPLSVVIGDFNNDGKQDITLANLGSKNVSIRLGGCAPGVQFSASAYSVSEGDGRVAVTVTRSGDLSRASSVGYATSDQSGLAPCSAANGLASQRCDYTNSVGTLRFAAGETSRTISIPIVDDSYAEGSETFTITLSPVGASPPVLTSATITITDNDAVSGSNPITGSEFFIRQLYMDFLGREPEPAGLQGWLNVLNNCGTTVAQPCDRIEVAANFFRSAEFQQRSYFIYRVYRTLDRNPRYSEFMPDFAKVSGFLTTAELEANKAAFIEEFMTRAEFKAKYNPTLADPTGYVDGLLQSVGLPNHPSRTTWIDGLTNQTLTRAQVLRALIESPEVYNKYYNEAFVVEMYFGFLRRDPDALYLLWTVTMNQTGDYRTLVSGFINANEFVQRFGP